MDTCYIKEIEENTPLTGYADGKGEYPTSLPLGRCGAWMKVEYV